MWGDNTPPTAGPAMVPTLRQQKDSRRANQAKAFAGIGNAAAGGVKAFKKYEANKKSDSGGANPMGGTNGYGDE